MSREQTDGKQIKNRGEKTQQTAARKSIYLSTYHIPCQTFGSQKGGDLQHGRVQRRDKDVGKACPVGGDDYRSGGEHLQLGRGRPIADELHHVETREAPLKGLLDLTNHEQERGGKKGKEQKTLVDHKVQTKTHPSSGGGIRCFPLRQIPHSIMALASAKAGAKKHTRGFLKHVRNTFVHT